MPTPISKRFTLEQLCATSHGENPLTACTRYGVRVELDELQANMEHLAQRILDPLWDAWIWRVSSCYRSPAVNQAVGGSSNSAHTVGLACDGAPSDGRGGFADVIRWLAAHAAELPLDRLIYEQRGTTRWLHVQALAPGANPHPVACYSSPREGLYLLTSAEVLAGVAA